MPSLIPRSVERVEVELLLLRDHGAGDSAPVFTVAPTPSHLDSNALRYSGGGCSRRQACPIERGEHRRHWFFGGNAHASTVRGLSWFDRLSDGEAVAR